MTDVTRAQIEAQLAGFPEAYWAAAAWPVDGEACKDVAQGCQRQACTPRWTSIHPDLKTQGVFQDAAWKVLTKELKLDGLQFWQPNTGILYPAVYELAERALGAAKATRPFDAMLEEGHRCTLTGEAEWLTHDRALLGLNRKDREASSVWGKLVKVKKSWVKPGEHLGAIATLKRLWPTLFAERISDLTGGTVRRFVVSTHALALSTTLEKLADPGTAGPPTSVPPCRRLAATAADYDTVTLPKALMRKLYQRLPQNQQQDTLRKLPALLEDPPDDASEGPAPGSHHSSTAGRQPPRNLLRPDPDGRRPHGRLAGGQ